MEIGKNLEIWVKLKTSWGWAGPSSAQVEALLADKVKVMIHLWALLVKLNNFTFGNKAVLCLESTILDGRPACLETLEI